MIVYRSRYRFSRHSEPVRTLAWESVPLRLKEPRDALHRKMRIATACEQASQ